MDMQPVSPSDNIELLLAYMPVCISLPCRYLSTSTSIIITLRDEHRLAIFPKKNRVSVIVDLADVQDGQQLPVKSVDMLCFHSST